MTRLLPMIVAIAAGIAFAAAIPTMAVAGIHAVPVAANAMSANADSCADGKRDVPSFVIVTCKKKAQSGKVVLCKQAHAVVPAAPHRPAVRVGVATACRTDAARADAGPERLHRPPRG